MASNANINGQNYDLSTYNGRQAARDANPGLIVDASSAYNPGTGQQINAGGGGSGGGGGGGGGPAAPAPAGLDASLQKMLSALASGNAQAFQEAKDEFNKNFTLSESAVTGKYNGNPTQQAQQQQFQQGIDTGNITGMYNGAPTEGARQFNTGVAQSLLNAATQLRGPQDYMQYQQLTHGGANLLSQLTGANTLAQTTPNSGQVRPASLSDIFNALGIGGGGTGGAGVERATGMPSSSPSDVQSQVLSAFGLSPGQTFSPNQVNPARYDESGSIGQALTQNMAQSVGYDPTDFVNQINANRPMGTAPRQTATAYRAPSGIF